MTAKIFSISIDANSPCRDLDEGWINVGVHWFDDETGEKHYRNINNIHPDWLPRILSAQRALVTRDPVMYDDASYAKREDTQ